MNKIGFLGMGKMGSAILRGIIENGLYRKEEIALFAPSQFTQDKYQNFLDISAIIINDSNYL